MPKHTSQDWFEWKDKTVSWILGQRTTLEKPSHFLFSNGSKAAVLHSTCYAIFALELFGCLKHNPEVELKCLESDLLSSQDPLSGHFRERLMKPRDFPRTGHNWDYVSWQLTFFCLSALDALDSKPEHSLIFLEDFLKKHILEDWLAGLDWNNPWLISNQIMFLLSFLLGGTNEMEEKAHKVFDWLDKHQSAETGFWDLGRPVPLLNAMAGSFHFYFLYFFANRRVNWPEKIIENTLKLQQPDGLYSPHGGGGSCHDLDAIDILVKFSLFCPHLESKVEASLAHSFEAILRNQTKSGAFCEAKRNLPAKSFIRRTSELLHLDRILDRPWPLVTMRHAGWKKMQYLIDEGDLWSTWFRPLALALISTRYPGEFISSIDWKFRGSPALGWHNAEQVISSQQ